MHLAQGDSVIELEQSILEIAFSQPSCVTYSTETPSWSKYLYSLLIR
jgi:hypothetical protein